VVEHLPSKHKALRSIPRTEKKKKKRKEIKTQSGLDILGYVCNITGKMLSPQNFLIISSALNL
jgi:hypothetical protein